ncbi:MAG: hypothetical protein ACTSYR_02340 [Candidatus Odinarchaeia archaeon]
MSGGKDNQCRVCSARSIALIELENYLIEKFHLKKIDLTSPPKDYLCIIRFIRRKHGMIIPVCLKPDSKPDEDIDSCLSKLKPEFITEFNGIFYLY